MDGCGIGLRREYGENGEVRKGVILLISPPESLSLVGKAGRLLESRMTFGRKSRSL